MINELSIRLAKLLHGTLVRRFLNGAGWSVGGAVVSSGITLLMMILVARLLGKTAYGQLIAIQSTLGMFGVFAGGGIGAVATRYAAELRTSAPSRLGRILTLAERAALLFGLVAAVAMVLASDWLAERILNDRNLGEALSIVAVAALFTSLDSYQKSLLIGFESIRAFAIATILGAMATFPIMLFATDHYGLRGAAVAVALGAYLQFQVSRYHVAKELRRFGIPRNARDCLLETPILWHLAVPALLVSALVAPTHWVVQVMLVNSESGYAQLAVLGVAMQWMNLIMFIPVNTSKVVAPILTEYVTRRDHASSWAILLLSVRANAIVSMPVALLAALLAPYIMALYGESFKGEHLPLVVAAMTAAILAIQAPVANLLVARSRMWMAAAMNAGWAGAYVALAYGLIPMGATGAMLALGAAYVLLGAWIFAFAFHYRMVETRRESGA